MEFVFILVEPGEPGNIGAAARAIKTMGFTQLWMVNPVNYLDGEAQWLAHGSKEILEKALIFDTLNEAINQLDFSIASSAKQRNISVDYVEINKIKSVLISKKRIINTIGVIFGRESSGLTNQEILMCDMVSYIPMTTTFPSLNLSQAVMIYAYELRKKEIFFQEENKNSDEYRFKMIKNKISLALQEIGFKTSQPIYHRMIERIAFVNEKDLKLLGSIAEKIRTKEK